MSNIAPPPARSQSQTNNIQGIVEATERRVRQEALVEALRAVQGSFPGDVPTHAEAAAIRAASDAIQALISPDLPPTATQVSEDRHAETRRDVEQTVAVLGHFMLQHSPQYEYDNADLADAEHDARGLLQGILISGPNYARTRALCDVDDFAYNLLHSSPVSPGREGWGDGFGEGRKDACIKIRDLVRRIDSDFDTSVADLQARRRR